MLSRTNTNPLQSWLANVNQHLAERRVDRATLPRPKRNRERERARREARQLFREYALELATLQ